METITHEGKTYSKQPATNLCVGCDFKHMFQGHNECHAPAEALCVESIYKEVIYEYDDDWPMPTRSEIAAFLLSILILILFVLGIISLAIYLLFIK